MYLRVRVSVSAQCTAKNNELYGRSKTKVRAHRQFVLAVVADATLLRLAPALRHARVLSIVPHTNTDREHCSVPLCGTTGSPHGHVSRAWPCAWARDIASSSSTQLTEGHVIVRPSGSCHECILQYSTMHRCTARGRWQDATHETRGNVRVRCGARLYSLCGRAIPSQAAPRHAPSIASSSPPPCRSASCSHETCLMHEGGSEQQQEYTVALLCMLFLSCVSVRIARVGLAGPKDVREARRQVNLIQTYYRYLLTARMQRKCLSHHRVRAWNTRTRVYHSSKHA